MARIVQVLRNAENEAIISYILNLRFQQYNTVFGLTLSFSISYIYKRLLFKTFNYIQKSFGQRNFFEGAFIICSKICKKFIAPNF